MGRQHPTVRDFPVGRDAAGKPLCRFCKGEVKPPRRTMCSEACVDALMQRTNPNHLREQVFKRDAGICSACGCDTEKIKRVLDHAWRSFAGLYGTRFGGRAEFQSAAKSLLDLMHWKFTRSNWEADHILEVVRGGEYSLANMQTLCVPCHKQKTARLASSRAQERRAEKQTLFSCVAS